MRRVAEWAAWLAKERAMFKQHPRGRRKTEVGKDVFRERKRRKAGHRVRASALDLADPLAHMDADNG